MSALITMTPGYHPSPTGGAVYTGSGTAWFELSAALKDDADRIKRLPSSASVMIALDFPTDRAQYIRLQSGEIRYERGVISIARSGKVVATFQPREYLTQHAFTLISTRSIPDYARYIELPEGIFVEVRSLFVEPTQLSFEAIPATAVHGSVIIGLPQGW